jgi:hypothetical protein
VGADKVAPDDDADEDLDEDERAMVQTFQAASQLKPEDIDRADKAVSGLSRSEAELLIPSTST